VDVTAPTTPGRLSRVDVQALAVVTVVGVLVVTLVSALSAGVETAFGVGPGVLVWLLWVGLVGYLLVSLRVTAVRREWDRRSLGLANALTIVRGGLYAAVGAFVVVPPGTRLAWVPAVCYGLGVVLDNVDGVVARTLGDRSELGRRLDLALDTFGFVVAPAVAVLWGRLPVYYLSLSVARYAFRAAVGWRRRRGRPVYDPPDSDLGRYLAGFQMVFLTVALAPVVPAGLLAVVAPLALAPSLAVFARDYLVVSGRLGGTAPRGEPRPGDD
jgi:CDP-diacylglycerol--glycerol-3-phosphate 3-phosphatidyltransferase